MADSCPSHAWLELIQCSLWKAHSSLVCLGLPDSTAAPYLEAILSSEITNEKHKNAKSVPLNRPQEGHLFAGWA